MKRLTILMAMLIATSGWAYDELDLIKFMATNTCEGCDLSGADLKNGEFSSAKLARANLKGADLSQSNFSNAELEQANLEDTMLIMTDFSKAYLSKANLQNAYIYLTNFSFADLEEANLKNSIPNGANFSFAQLGGANLANIDFTERSPSNFKNVKFEGLYNKDLKAIFCRTKMPWGELNDGCFGEY